MVLVHFGLLQPVVFRKSTELGKNLFEKLQAGTVIKKTKSDLNKKNRNKQKNINVLQNNPTKRGLNWSSGFR